MAKLRTYVLTPITPSSWGHISRLSKNAYLANTKWAFLKADHDSAYNQLPLGPAYEGLTVVTIRGPILPHSACLFPHVLLFRAASAVIDYNCFARPLAPVINRASGILALNYFGDCGALGPDKLGRRAFWLVENVSHECGAPMKTIKSLVDPHLTLLSLLGAFRDPDKGLLLFAELPAAKIAKWRHIILDHAAAGRTTAKHLEKMIGEISFAQTSEFGRFGRTPPYPPR